MAVFWFHFGDRFLTQKKAEKSVHRQSVDTFFGSFLGQKTVPKSAPSSEAVLIHSASELDALAKVPPSIGIIAL